MTPLSTFLQSGTTKACQAVVDNLKPIVRFCQDGCKIWNLIVSHYYRCMLVASCSDPSPRPCGQVIRAVIRKWTRPLALIVAVVAHAHNESDSEHPMSYFWMHFACQIRMDKERKRTETNPSNANVNSILANFLLSLKTRPSSPLCSNENPAQVSGLWNNPEYVWVQGCCLCGLKQW